MTIKTIGHSNHPVERFLDLLQLGGVELLVDVRSRPYSRRFPHFGRERLARSLDEAGIGYLWEGEALGGMGGPYNTVAARPDFANALDRLVERSHSTTLCLMCAEKEPLDCHRTVLVSRRLAERGLDVIHLLAGGGTLRHSELEEQLLAKKASGDLFDDRATRLARAWDAREFAMRGKAS